MNRASVGGEFPVWVGVSSDALDLVAASDFVADPSSGCTVTFTGTVRDHSDGRSGVTHLEYEAYQDVVEAKIGEIVDEARERWPLIGVAALHRTGRVELGEPSVLVAVSAAHRVDAFPAARYIIDELKARAPIWKKEHWPGGAEWVEGA